MMTGLDTSLKQVNIFYQYGGKNSKWPKKYKILRKMVISQKLSTIGFMHIARVAVGWTTKLNLFKVPMRV